MKTIAVIGANCAGTMISNHLRKILSDKEWDIVCLDRDPTHHYQPGYLYIPFNLINRKKVLRPKQKYIDKGVKFIVDEVVDLDVEKRSVKTAGNETINYDFLILATGCRIDHEVVEGLDTIWRKKAFDFYSLEGAEALAGALKDFDGGRLLINIAEVPYKCPVAPMEFAYMADDYLTRRGIRNKTDIVLSTPMPKLLKMDIVADALAKTCKEKNIDVITEFTTESVEDNKVIELAGEEREIPFDFLVIIPPNFGDALIEKTGLDNGNLGYVPTNPHTLKARFLDRVYVIGDGSDLPTSKAGSVAHFSVPIIADNLMAEIEGREPLKCFDGHANCFIETGKGKAFLIDFCYYYEALPGLFPLQDFGPFSLVKQTRVNHWGKLMFNFVYWNILLKDRHMPFVSDKFTIMGKNFKLSGATV